MKSAICWINRKGECKMNKNEKIAGFLKKCAHLPSSAINLAISNGTLGARMCHYVRQVGERSSLLIMNWFELI